MHYTRHQLWTATCGTSEVPHAAVRKDAIDWHVAAFGAQLTGGCFCRALKPPRLRSEEHKVSSRYQCCCPEPTALIMCTICSPLAAGGVAIIESTLPAPRPWLENRHRRWQASRCQIVADFCGQLTFIFRLSDGQDGISAWLASCCQDGMIGCVQAGDTDAHQGQHWRSSLQTGHHLQAEVQRSP